MTTWVGMLVARISSTIDYLRGQGTSEDDVHPPSKIASVPYFIAMSLNHALSLLRAAVQGLPGTKIPFYPSRVALLQAAAAVVPPDGLWLEFGVFEGRTINVLAGLTTHTVHGFDSFEGLPVRWGAHFPAGRFTLGGRLPKVAANVRLWPGWFSETIPPFLRECGGSSIALLHVDCDLYSSALVVLRGLCRHLAPGSVIVFDEFITAYPEDESRAFREFRERTGLGAEYIGSSRDGSVAVKVIPTSGGGRP